MRILIVTLVCFFMALPQGYALTAEQQAKMAQAKKAIGAIRGHVDSVTGDIKASRTEADLEEIREEDARAKAEWAYSTAIQAYTFALPLLIVERERRIRMLLKKPHPLQPAAPINQFGHLRRLATADHPLPYTPNNDTVYSGMAIDFDGEPLIISYPDMGERYWSFQVANSYTANLGYVGCLTDPPEAGEFAILPPDWAGELPKGMKSIRLTQQGGMIAVRITVSKTDPADMKRLHKLQNQIITTALSDYLAGGAGSKIPSWPTSLTKYPRIDKSDPFAFYKEAAYLMGKYPPTAQHNTMLKTFETIGLVPGQPFDPQKLDPAMRDALVRGIKAGAEILRWKVKFRGHQSPTYWNVDLTGGSYNDKYLDRAEGAVQGLFVHDPEWGTYFHTYSDSENRYLDGSKRYKLHFTKDQLPKVHKPGFWSVTMYGANYQLVKNEINRFSIGDRTPDIKYNADGSVTLYLQSTPPAGHESNWLPTPKSGIFRLNYRVYLPREEMIKDNETVYKYLTGVERL